MVTDGQRIEYLRNLGYVGFEAEFFGSGDEGDVHSLKLFPEDMSGVDDIDMLWDWARELADRADYDWWNNEGGCGKVAVDLLTGEAVWDRKYYETIEVPLEPKCEQLLSGGAADG